MYVHMYVDIDSRVVVVVRLTYTMGWKRNGARIGHLHKSN